MTTLERLQSWYMKQCDGDWEHSNGITISTLDNPGWSIEIRIEETAVESKSFARLEREKTETDWMHAWSTGQSFCVRCGPNNLEEALILFCDWAGA